MVHHALPYWSIFLWLITKLRAALILLQYSCHVLSMEGWPWKLISSLKNTVRSDPSLRFWSSYLYNFATHPEWCFLWLYDEVGVDVHEKHEITWEANFIMTRARQNEVAALDYSLSKEIFVIEDNHNTDFLGTSETPYSLRSSEMAAASM